MAYPKVLQFGKRGHIVDVGDSVESSVNLFQIDKVLPRFVERAFEFVVRYPESFQGDQIANLRERRKLVEANVKVDERSEIGDQFRKSLEIVRGQVQAAQAPEFLEV